MLSRSLNNLVLQTPRATFLSTLSRPLSTAPQLDVIVIGGGPGGYVAAIKAGQLGLKTACVEMRGSMGGTCLNVGCIPSKALLQSSHHYHDLLHNFTSHGIVFDKSSVSMDLTKMMTEKNKTVKGLTGGIEHLLKKNKVDYHKGHAKITGANEVTVTNNDGTVSVLNAANIVIATGSEVSPLPPVPVDNARGLIVDSTGALDIKKIPKTLAVVGGGVIGLELGSVWARLGTKVTVIEYMDRICPAMDIDLTKQFQKTLKKQGFSFNMNTKVVKSEVHDDDSGVTITTEGSKGGDSKSEKYDVVLVSTGRRPFTAGLGLEELGITVDKLGRIDVDNQFKTTHPSIRAIGDCIPGPMLAHKAEEEGIAVIELIAGYAGHVNYNAIPGVIYTYPEVASVGKTEEELKADGVKYNKGVFPFAANSRARANGDTEGMVKILTDSSTDRILGAHIMCSNAGEMIAEAVLGMEYGASSEDVARTCHAHPTLSEAFKEACMSAYDKPIHM